MQAVN